jgi:hypothetical protein
VSGASQLMSVGGFCMRLSDIAVFSKALIFDAKLLHDRNIPSSHLSACLHCPACLLCWLHVYFLYCIRCFSDKPAVRAYIPVHQEKMRMQSNTHNDGYYMDSRAALTIHANASESSSCIYLQWYGASGNIHCMYQKCPGCILS